MVKSGTINKTQAQNLLHYFLIHKCIQDVLDTPSKKYYVVTSFLLFDPVLVDGAMMAVAAPMSTTENVVAVWTFKDKINLCYSTVKETK